MAFTDKSGGDELLPAIVCPASFGWPLMLSLRRSTLLIRMEDIVLVLHRHMAHLPAVSFGLVGRHVAGRDIMVEERVSPAAGRRNPLAVLLDDESLSGGVRHIYDEGGLRALLEAPLELRDLGAFRETLTIARNAGLVRLDHSRIGYDH